MHNNYGYAYAATGDQDVSDQLEAIGAFGVDDGDVYVDRPTKRGASRSQYKKLLRHLRKGDVMVVRSLDCLGSSASEIVAAWQAITKDRRADVVVLDVPLLDTRTTPYNMAGEVVEDVVLQVLGAVVQIEHDARQRVQAAGIARAKQKGVHCGRAPMPQPKNYGEVREAYLDHQITRKDAAARLGVSTSTFDKWLRASRRQEEGAVMHVGIGEVEPNPIRPYGENLSYIEPMSAKTGQ